MSVFTLETFKKALPKQMGKRVSQDMVDRINTTISDPDIRENVLDNILSYSSVLKDGKYKMDSYIDAVKYVSYKSMGDSNIQSWTKVFPNRYARLIANNVSEKDISAHVAMYNKTQLVNSILEQTLIPVHIMNAHHLQEAINVHVRLMHTAKSEKVQGDSATALLTHLKPPETKKIELDVGVSEGSSVIQELRAQTALLAARQQELIAGGVTTAQEAAHQSLVLEGEVVEDE